MSAFVLITGFEPFLGRPRNLSGDLVEKLELPFASRKLILPVIYEASAQVVIDFVRKVGPPAWALSFGEAIDDIRLETRAHNLNNTSSPDNTGAVRQNKVVAEGAPAELGMSLPLRRLKPLVEAGAARLSTSPGYFVCNDTAFRLQGFFGGLGIPYGFIHVPKYTEGAPSEANVTRLVDVTKTVQDILNLLIRNESGGETETRLPFTKSPASREEAAAELRIMAMRERPAAWQSGELDFLAELVKRYDRESKSLSKLTDH